MNDSSADHEASNRTSDTAASGLNLRPAADLSPSDARLQERISRFCQPIPRSVRLIAISKTLPASTIRLAYAAGLRDFGESRIQEAAVKQAELADLPDLTWHLIGRLQSNKAQKALELFDWIHSVDSLALAQRLDRLAAAAPDRASPQICLQVKLREDPSKTGWSRSLLLQEFAALQQLRHLRLRGLMVIPPYGSPETAQIFQEAKVLLTQLQAAYPEPRSPDHPEAPFDQLSMGMSDDYGLAIQAGATMIRPGRALFGDRPAAL
jgi:PLP dependent protein